MIPDSPYQDPLLQQGNDGLSFKLLGISAFFILQGVLIGNGGFWAITIATLVRRLPNGKPIPTQFTGLPVVDDVLALATAFWDPIITETQTSRLQAALLCASLQSFALFAMIEWARNGRKHLVLKYAPLLIFVWQALGTGIFFPFYCIWELEQHSTNHAGYDPSISLPRAIGFLPAAFIALALPFKNAFFPYQGVGEIQHSVWIGTYTLAPFVFYCLITTVEMQVSRHEGAIQDHDHKASIWWTKLAYLCGGCFSAIIHIVILIGIVTSGIENTTVRSFFLPTWGSISNRTAALQKSSNYIKEYHFFLQWDLLFVICATAIYCARMVRARITLASSYPMYLVLLVLFGWASFIISPGAVVAVVLYYREQTLRAVKA